MPYLDDQQESERHYKVAEHLILVWIYFSRLCFVHNAFI